MGVTSERLPHKGRLLAVLLMGSFMAQADATIANVATPSIREDLGASGAALELVVGGYMIAFAVLLITGARLGQTHGYRRVFVLGVTTFTVASALCGLAPTPAVLVAARVLQGAGAALMFPQTLTGIQLSFQGAERARAIGIDVLLADPEVSAASATGDREAASGDAASGDAALARAIAEAGNVVLPYAFQFGTQPETIKPRVAPVPYMKRFELKGSISISPTIHPSLTPVGGSPIGGEVMPKFNHGAVVMFGPV